MTAEKDFVDLIKTQLRLEENTAKQIKELEAEITNLAAKLLLAEMRFDTEKHAKILIKILGAMEQYASERSTTNFWQIETAEYVDALVVKQMLENHVNVETKMLDQVKKEMKNTDDAAIKMLLQHIINDEKKHHEILEGILENAFKMESLK